MSRLKTYEFEGREFKAYNKEEIRRRLRKDGRDFRLQDMTLIKLVDCIRHRLDRYTKEKSKWKKEK